MSSADTMVVNSSVDMDGQTNSRFKVVKIDSQRKTNKDDQTLLEGMKSFKRGRWTITDFYDSTTSPPLVLSNVVSPASNPASNHNSTPGTPTPSLVKILPLEEESQTPPSLLVDDMQSPNQSHPLAQPVAQVSASTVAIDNKIEQAMDLVKSHLTLAVREEVDVLKEKIDRLMERIQSLETENSILKQQQQTGQTQSLLTSINISHPTSPVNETEPPAVSSSTPTSFSQINVTGNTSAE